MKATKHYEHGHVIVYIIEDGLQTCMTFDDERQMARAGGCLPDPKDLGAAIDFATMYIKQFSEI